MNIRTYEQIVADMLAKIAERTKLTNFNIGSVIRTLVEVFGSAVADLGNLTLAALKAGFLATATGFWLDLKAKEFGVTRHPAEKTEGVVYFMRSVPRDENITIPAGTIVSTLKDSEGKAYRYLSDLEIIDLIDVLPWNPRKPQWPRQRDVVTIDKVILHQELGNGDAAAVNEYHRRYDPRGSAYGRNWPRIAYHFVIPKDGAVEQVNDLTDVTWHCRGQNTHSIGIMLVGDFAGPGHEGEEPTPEQEQAFFALAKHLMEVLGLGPDVFFGHADLGKPACPGYTAHSWIQTLRK